MRKGNANKKQEALTPHFTETLYQNDKTSPFTGAINVKDIFPGEENPN